MQLVASVYQPERWLMARTLLHMPNKSMALYVSAHSDCNMSMNIVHTTGRHKNTEANAAKYVLTWTPVPTDAEHTYIHIYAESTMAARPSG